jgi:alkyldihydroxyacetonephosphate synthase
VCGGVEAAVGDAFAGSISIDMGRMQRVLEVDKLSRAARIQAGVLGPSLEAQLKPHGLTLRHYPQSFEFSSLGGWIATRSAGHFATVYTHIDELVEAVRVVTPSGTLETRRLPGDGAGPSAERLFIGSEGILGVICEAWVRLFERPRFRASTTASFSDFAAAVRATRALAQSGLNPQNCRLLDGLEALMNGVGSTDRALLIIGFESHDHPPNALLARAAELCRDAGAELPDSALRFSAAVKPESSAATDRDEMALAWRRAFLRAPYLRDELVLRGVFVETFETAVTWDRFETLHAAVMEAARRSAEQASGGSPLVTCRITHVYPDGAAPYFTVVCPARRGVELAQWQTIKSAITEAMLNAGGTVTHHHAVGRDFRPWYDRQRPDGFARALEGAKTALDPRGIMNPGVLI